MSHRRIESSCRTSEKLYNCWPWSYCWATPHSLCLQRNGRSKKPTRGIRSSRGWQADTFDPQRIDKELGWAESIGMNTMRVFLHDLVWKQDPAGFKRRLNTFLTIADK